MTTRAETPKWLPFLEGCVVMTWIVMLSGLSKRQDETLALFFIAAILMLCGTAMSLLREAVGIKTTFILSIAFLAAGSSLC
jgi:hypothetical protein